MMARQLYREHDASDLAPHKNVLLLHGTWLYVCACNMRFATLDNRWDSPMSLQISSTQDIHQIILPLKLFKILSM